MKLKPWLKNILSCLVISTGGFVLFNLAFLLAAFVIKTTMYVMEISENEAPPVISKAIFLFLVLLISWIILKSRFHTLIKATFLTMPLMVTLIFAGIQFYQQSIWVIIGIGTVIIGLILFYLTRINSPGSIIFQLFLWRCWHYLLRFFVYKYNRPFFTTATHEVLRIIYARLSVSDEDEPCSIENQKLILYIGQSNIKRY